MKKIAGLLIPVIVLLVMLGCELTTHKTHTATITNMSHYPAELTLYGYKKNDTDDKLFLYPKQVKEIIFYSWGTAELVSKNYNVLEKISASKYIITNLPLLKYTISNFLPIEIKLLDNKQYLLANKDTQKNIPTLTIPCEVSDCYFFKQIKLNNIFIDTSNKILISGTTYSIKKIANFYYLQINSNSHSECHKINIDISPNEIVFSH